ncbi:Hypothetical predicted protein [Mytilus galloprovincialis]|uniref:Uncharacterized protein n=1 Tax=Mytilus galloprovincialis TaxID=29158 RepID=A0A8B6GAK7_MYTGA|nr:Hypothetical predicted protein [Mytilus galloprovincialis]
MSIQKYDFVGVSTTQLPYVHGNFPAGQKIGTAKYYTMRSMQRRTKLGIASKGTSKGHTRQLVDLKLPALDIKSQSQDTINSMNPRLHYGNIYKQKAYFRLKGIPIRKMYTLNRAKTEKYEEDDDSLNAESRNKSVSLTLLDLKEPESKPANESNEEENEYSGFDNCESPWTRSRLRELDDESPIPGFRSRNSKNGRKLGNIVSSRRLQQLLDNEDTLDPYSFYMY